MLQLPRPIGPTPSAFGALAASVTATVAPAFGHAAAHARALRLSLGLLAASLLAWVLGSTQYLAIAIAATIGHEPWMHRLHDRLATGGATVAALSVTALLVQLASRRTAASQDR